MFGLTNKIFIGLLTGLVNECNYTKCMLLSNQKCMTQSTLINLHSKEYRQEFQYYPFAVNLDKCAGSFNTLNDLSNKVCVPNKTGDLNLSVSNMITGINASKTLTNIYNANVNVGLMEENLIQINGDKCQFESKKHHVCEKDYVWNLSTDICENGKYLAYLKYLNEKYKYYG